jgi:DeoR family fructose operon transcriptional repressor
MTANGGKERGLQSATTRQAAILNTLRTRGQVKAVQVAEELGVTHETIRKDILALEAHGLLRRVHGGALPVESISFEPDVSSRTAMSSEKQRIAAAAIEYLPTTGAVLIDAGSTTAALAANLPHGTPLVTITNALPIALALTANPQLTVHMLGGRIRRATMATVDAWALRDLEELRVDVAFVGTNAFSLDHGLSTPDAAEAAVKRTMIEAARLTVLLADHTKFGREAVFKYADLDMVDVLVTDDGMTAAEARSLEVGAGVEVVRV